MKPRFDPTINLGHVISLGGVIVVVTGSLYLTDYRLNALELKVPIISEDELLALLDGSSEEPEGEAPAEETRE